MASDPLPDEPVASHEKAPEKKKKRRPRKKKNAVTKDVQSKSADIALDPPPLPEQSVPMSPRKQTLLRHQKSNLSEDEPLFLSEVKELKKNRRPLTQNHMPRSENEKFNVLLASYPMDDRTTIFRAPFARIVVYHEQVPDSGINASSGTLLGHGEFTIFQLHNGDITYLACGPSFVYPLLRKLKILRVSRSHFILPLVNPQRYWKMEVDSQEDAVLEELEKVFQKFVNYTSLFLVSSPVDDGEKYEKEKESADSHAGHVQLSMPDMFPLRGSNEQTEYPISPHASSPNFQAKGNQFTPFFNNIPESPPSVPVSPNQFHLYDSKLPILPSRSPNLEHDHFGLLSHPNAYMPIQTKLTKPLVKKANNAQIANPYHHTSQQSDSSSMDSLLDEYEENVSMTRSINYNGSRMPSRTASFVSISHHPLNNYARGNVLILPERSVAGSIIGDKNKHEDDGVFPTTSLSQYNRNRRNSQNGLSRRSSVSELYTSVSNWMDPSTNGPKLSHSRSNYTLASRQSNRPINVKDTYQDIYRSITLHNVAALAGREKNLEALPEPKYPSGDLYYSKLLVTDQFSRKPVGTKTQANTKSTNERLNRRSSRISSSDVYNLISRKEEKIEASSGIGRFFGW